MGEGTPIVFMTGPPFNHVLKGVFEVRWREAGNLLRPIGALLWKAEAIRYSLTHDRSLNLIRPRG
jgi:hypothetical protein